MLGDIKTFTYTFSSTLKGFNVDSLTNAVPIFEVVRLGFKRALTSCLDISIPICTTTVGTIVWVLVIDKMVNVSDLTIIRGAGIGSVVPFDVVGGDCSFLNSFRIRSGSCKVVWCLPLHFWHRDLLGHFKIRWFLARQLIQ